MSPWVRGRILKLLGGRFAETRKIKRSGRAARGFYSGDFWADLMGFDLIQLDQWSPNLNTKQ